ncbi:MAG: 30S ribosomal protein S4e [Promethearchaeota archaeon]
MGSKGNKRYLKRLNTNKYVHIHKKEGKYFYKPSPGPHPKDFCLPLAHLLRDILKIVQNGAEAKKVIKAGKILVDGRIRKDPKFPVGLMDVVEIPSINKVYRVIPRKRYGLDCLEIDEKEKKFKLCRIENKVTIKGGHIQLNLNDGRNIIMNVKNPKKPVEDKYKTKDVLKIEIPSQKILDYYPLRENSPILVIRGKNLGMWGYVKSIEKRFGPNASVVKINVETEDGEIESHETAYAYSFVIGKTKPEIKLFE